MNSTTNDTLMDVNNISDHQYTIAMMLFLVAYSLFEAPSNMALKFFQPHRWLGFLVVAFGAFCTGIGSRIPIPRSLCCGSFSVLQRQVFFLVC